MTKFTIGIMSLPKNPIPQWKPNPSDIKSACAWYGGQIALIPLVCIMMWAVEGKPYVWRWNLLTWVMMAGYLIGLLALPFSYDLDKAKFLKWWLRIDFVVSICYSFHYISLSSYWKLISCQKEVGMYYLQQVE